MKHKMNHKMMKNKYLYLIIILLLGLILASFIKPLMEGFREEKIPSPKKFKNNARCKTNTDCVSGHCAPNAFGEKRCIKPLTTISKASPLVSTIVPYTVSKAS